MILNLDDKESQIVEEFARINEMSKSNAIRKIIRLWMEGQK